MAKGIDISEWQTGVNYPALAEHIEFAILRAGGTSRDNAASYYGDDLFDPHYAGLTTQGIPLGAYWYSTAATEAEGAAEAAEMLKRVAGKAWHYPLYIDAEEGRCKTDGVIGFCRAIEAAGYYVGVYANEDYLYNRLEADRLKAWDVWLASWGDSPSSPLPYGLWQTTSDGHLPGYDGRLDMDTALKDYPAIITAAGLNHLSGQAPTPPTPPPKPVAPPIGETLSYTVRSGDTLSGIGARFGVDWRQLAEINSIADPNLIYPGQIILIKRSTIPAPNTYTVRPGDSFWAIADNQLGDGTRYDELARYNNMTPEDVIHPGDVLRLPD